VSCVARTTTFRPRLVKANWSSRFPSSLSARKRSKRSSYSEGVTVRKFWPRASTTWLHSSSVTCRQKPALSEKYCSRSSSLLAWFSNISDCNAALQSCHMPSEKLSTKSSPVLTSAATSSLLFSGAFILWHTRSRLLHCRMAAATSAQRTHGMPKSVSTTRDRASPRCLSSSISSR